MPASGAQRLRGILPVGRPHPSAGWLPGWLLRLTFLHVRSHALRAGAWQAFLPCSTGEGRVEQLDAGALALDPGAAGMVLSVPRGQCRASVLLMLEAVAALLAHRIQADQDRGGVGEAPDCAQVARTLAEPSVALCPEHAQPGQVREVGQAQVRRLHAWNCCSVCRSRFSRSGFSRFRFFRFRFFLWRASRCGACADPVPSITHGAQGTRTPSAGRAL